MLSCHDVAEYFLALTDEDAGDFISNLKLQKLAYYAQGFHLALYGEPLFKERIMAWTHGPVVPDLYHAYKQYESGPIPPPEVVDFEKYDQRTRELLDEVYQVFGQYSAWKLRNLTHEEPPWLAASDHLGEITPKAMQEYFKTQIIED